MLAPQGGLCSVECIVYEGIDCIYCIQNRVQWWINESMAIIMCTIKVGNFLFKKLYVQ